MANQQSTTQRKMIEAYRATDSLSGRAYCKAGRETATAWVRQDLARWCKSGKAVQLTETVAEASATSSVITASDSRANVGLEGSEARIEAARCKVKAWPLVGSDPTYGALNRSTGIRVMPREELERSTAGFDLAFVDLEPIPPLRTHTNVGGCQDLDEDDDKTEAEHAESGEESLREQTCHEADVERYLSGDEETPDPLVAKSLVDVESDENEAAAHWLQENEESSQLQESC